MKKILVTGSNGLLGQKLVHQLKTNPEVELIATARGKNRISDQSSYKFFDLDITKKGDVEKLITQLKPDVIINTAAMTNVDACEEFREACWELNVDAVQYLVEASEKNNVHFIHLSTDFIFDGEDGPYREEDEPNPLSYYAKSKLASEEIVKKMKSPWSIVRTVLVYGLVEDMSRSNIVLWAKGALEKGQTLTIVNDQFRTPTLAEDLALGCILIALKKAVGVYHISGKDYMSIIELVHRVAKHYQLNVSEIKEITSASLNQAAKRPPRTGFILDKAMHELGYHPHSFEEGLKELDQQLKSNSSYQL
ncbi:MAG: NAD(P)-dependent oxidoreductase [Verrucomicrobia bacterium]|nr:NAD(P)-dependent oxidoreductase [Verrucomicrobiota bacterium]